MTEPIDTLAEQILADARKQAEPLGKRAQREIEALRRKAEEEAVRAREEVVQRAEESARVRAQRIRARGELEVENARRRATEEILTEVRERAMAKLAETTRLPEYPEMLGRLALAALGAMNGERVELLMRAEDVERHGAEVVRAVSGNASRELGRPVEIALSRETIDGAGGLIVRSADGRQVCDQTFEARMERLWSQLREDVAKEVLPG